MRVRSLAACVAVVFGVAGSAWAQTPGWQVEIAPIYLWAPVHISTVTLPESPELPPPPGGGTRPSGETGATLNGAAMAAFRLEKNRWLVRGAIDWAGLSGENERPWVKVSGDILYAEIFGGFEVVNRLFVEGGARRLAIDVSAEVLDYPEVSRTFGFWDPVVGVSYRLPMGSHWLLSLHGDAGGFGAGSDIDTSVSAAIDWRPASHFGLTFGYQYLYFRVDHRTVDSKRLEKVLTLGTSLSGPTAGITLLF